MARLPFPPPCSRLALLLFFQAAALLLPAAPVRADAPATEWIMRYTGPGDGSSRVTDMALDAHGCTYVIGYSAGLLWDVAVVKYSPGGRLLHEARFDGGRGGDDVPYGIALGPHGEVYVCGYTDGDGKGNRDFLTMKYDTTLVRQWIRTYAGQSNLGADEAYAVAADTAGNAVVTGSSYEPATDNDIVTVKYDASGTRLWVSRYNGIGDFDDRANAIALDDLGNVYVCGAASRNPFGDNYDMVTLKYDASGAQQWVELMNGTANANDGALGLTLDTDRNVYVCGVSTSAGAVCDMATVKYSSAGELLWSRTFDGNHANDAAEDITLDAAGNVCVTGYATFSGAQSDYATLKYTPWGVLRWSRAYNGPVTGFDQGKSIAADRDGNLYVTGYSDRGLAAVDYDYATVKYDSAGAQQWVARYQGTGNNIDLAVKLLLDTADDVIVTGWSTGTHLTEVDFTTIKYGQAGSSTAPPPRASCPEPAVTAAPNPFDALTNLRLLMPEAGPVDVAVWDPAGRKVRNLVHGWLEPGEHAIRFDGRGLGPGVFLYRAQTAQGTATGKLVRR